MSKRLVLSALAQFTAKTAGRNTRRAHRVGAVLWTCLVYFVFEWLVRLRHMVPQGRTDTK